MVDTREALAAALRIGERLVASAVWADDACNWLVQVPDPANSRATIATPSGGTLYQGTAGIGLFLAELARCTGDEQAARVAEGAFRHAVRAVHDTPPGQCGLYSGWSGIMHALLQARDALGTEEFEPTALGLLQGGANRAAADRGLDLIAGGAGAIPALVHAWRTRSSAVALELALEYGHHLVNAARRSPNGWSWGSGSLTQRDHLCGYAHGASGFAHAFLELYAATGDPNWRYAAGESVRYERSHFSAAAGNWPDLREMSLSELHLSSGMAGLRDLALHGGWPSPRAPAFMSAWCHGAPGIALVRLRARELLGAEWYAGELATALTTTAASLRRQQNPSLCHGALGNAEVLLEAARQGMVGEHLEAFEECVSWWLTRERTGAPWPGGTMGNAPDPSLLLGESGVGYFLLRLADPSVASVLLLRGAEARAVDGMPPATNAPSFRSRGIHEYFGMTLAVLARRTQGPGEMPASEADVDLTDGALTVAHRWLRERVQTEPDPQWREPLLDVFGPESRRFELDVAGFDLCEALHARLVATDGGEPRRLPVELADGLELLESWYDWRSWLASGPAPGAEPPARLDDPTVTLLARRGHQTTLQRDIAPLAAAVLQRADGRLGESLIRELCEDSEVDGEDGVLPAVIDAQLRAAWNAGLLRPAAHAQA